jgi:hypothetical protein
MGCNPTEILKIKKNAGTIARSGVAINPRGFGLRQPSAAFASTVLR